MVAGVAVATADGEEVVVGVAAVAALVAGAEVVALAEAGTDLEGAASQAPTCCRSGRELAVRTMGLHQGHQLTMAGAETKTALEDAAAVVPPCVAAAGVVAAAQHTAATPQSIECLQLSLCGWGCRVMG